MILKDTPSPSPFFPIIGNSFGPGLQDSCFGELLQRNVFKTHHFAVSSCWPIIEELAMNPMLCNLNIWSKTQLLHFLASLSPRYWLSHANLKFEKMRGSKTPIQHAISLIYGLLNFPSFDVTLN